MTMPRTHQRAAVSVLFIEQLSWHQWPYSWSCAPSAWQRSLTYKLSIGVPVICRA